MNKKLISPALGLIILTALLLNLVISAQAQGVSTTPTPDTGIVTTVTPSPTAIQEIAASPVDPNVVTLAQLQRNEIELYGPFDVNFFTFNIPATWKPTSGAQLILRMNISFNSGNTITETQSSYLPVNGGTLTIRINNQVVAVIPLNQTGEVENRIQIPANIFTDASFGGSITLGLTLNAGSVCISNDYVALLIHSSSYFLLPHDLIQPTTNLADFPRPIYQNTFETDSVLLIIPDHPSAGELQAALTTAASLGSISADTVLKDMTTLSNFAQQQRSSEQSARHMIFIGKASSLSVLSSLKLPFPIKGGQFPLEAGKNDDGIIQMINSPWSSAHVALVLSGNTDAGVIKAAQAMSTGTLRSSEFPNFAEVQQVNATATPPARAVDQTLTSLGLPGGVIFNSRGVGNATFRFDVPAGWTVSPDAYFALVFSNSKLLNYNRSGIVLLLNNRPIGSVRLSDTTADQGTNRVQIDIPASAVVSGSNLLEIRSTILPLDDCAPVTGQSLWINIWPDSTLHLPLDLVPENPVSNTDLAAYPAPFTYDPTLSNTAVILPHDDLDSWRAAMQIAGYLGSQANGTLTELSVFYGDEVPDAQRTNHNFLVIGRPSQLPIVNTFNSSLPAPFSTGQDIATESSFQVTYRIPSSSPMGYVEILPSPWNPANIILAALGNTPQGVNWATSSLINSALRARLAGNLAVINDTQIVTSNSRVAAVTTGNVAATSIPDTLSIAPDGIQTAPTPVSRPAWVIPSLILTIVLIIVILVMISLRAWSRNHKQKTRKEG